MDENTLQYTDAIKLVNSGEWIFQSGIWDQIIDTVQIKITKLFEADESLEDKVLVSSPTYELNWETGEPEKTGTHLTLPKFDSTIHLLRDDVESNTEAKHYSIPSEIDNYNMVNAELRIREGTIYKIGPMINKSKWKVIGIIGAVLSIARWDVLTLVSTLASTASDIKEVVRILRSGWERLTDPKEYFIFEKIFTLQGKSSVENNYDALANKDYDHAYKFLAPSLQDIEDSISSHVPKSEIPVKWRESSPDLWKDDLYSTLNELKVRNILKEKDGRWSLVF